MPVIPEFQPMGAPGGIIQNSQSLMMRANADRRANEAMEMERQKFEIMRPVLESQARVQLVSEANDLASAYTVNEAIAGDLQRFPQYVKDWTISAQIEDPKERLTERRRILGAITPFASIKSTAPMVKAFQEQFAQDAQADKTADVLAGRVEVVGAQNDARAAKTAADNEIKLTLKQKDAEIAEMKAKYAADLREAQLAQREREVEAKTKSAEKIAQGRSEGAAARPREKAARDFNEAELKKVEPATADLAKFARALDILDLPEVRTGTAAGIQLATERLGQALGVPVKGTANAEELQAILNGTFLSLVQNMKGSLSDKDREALIAMGPSLGKTAEGNRALVTQIVQRLSRNVAMGRAILSSREEGNSEMETQGIILREMMDTPMEAFTPARGAPSGGLTPDEQKRLQELRTKLGK